MSGGDVDLDERMDAVSQRVEFLELLEEQGALGPRDIVDALEHSRSTVTRALRTLRDADLVERSPEGYEVTPAGVLAAEQYRRYRTASRAALEAKDVLHALDPSDLPPVEVLIGADTVRAESDVPVRAVETVTDRVRDADRVDVYLPTLVDTHLLRVWHRAVTAGAVEGTAVFDPELLAVLKGQYPGLLSEMAGTDGFGAGETEGPPYGLLLTESDGTTAISLVVYEDATAVRGVITNTDAEAVEWARSKLARLREEATDVDADLRALGAAGGPDRSASPPPGGAGADGAGSVGTGSGSQSAAHALPVALEAEGFVRLSPEYFESRECAPPSASWRTGFTLTEVRAGHAVDRVDGEGRRLSDRLLEGLAAGDSHVVIGPPGAGKSTTCMAVACRWYEEERGPVLYRERGGGDRFDSAALLTAYLRQTAGHALVVVEDAVRDEAAAVFDVMQSFGNDPSVTFLIDAREHGWRNAGDLATDARLDTYRRSALTQVRMPPLTAADCDRFVGHYADLVGADPGLTGAELFARIEQGTDGGRDDRLPAGSALIAQHHISRHHEAATGEVSPTALDETVGSVYRELADAAPPATLDLAVLVSTLDAASVPVAPEYAYALAAGEGADGYDAVDRARSRLEGTLLFERESRRAGSTTAYRTRHETWSVRFLEQLLENEPPRRARETFGRVVSRLLALADDDAARDRIERHLGGRTPHLHRIAADPEGWAREVISRVFGVGQTETALAPLFGETAGDPIELPDACPDWVAVQTTYWRGYMNRIHGDFERAEREFRTLEELAGDVEFEAASGLEPAAFESGPAEAADPAGGNGVDDPAERRRHRWCAKARINLGILERERGNLDAAAEQFRAGQRQYRRAGDEHGEAEARKHLGATAFKRGELDTATATLEESVERFREVGDRHNEAKALNNLGICAGMRGDLAAAAERFNRSLDRFREVGDRYNEAKVLGNLATNATKRGDPEAAEEYGREALTGFREIGDRHGRATVRGELGVIARERGDYGAALTHLETARDLFREVGDRHAEAKTRHDIGEVGRLQGDHEAARGHLEDALAVFEEVGDRRMQATVLASLGDTARDSGAVDTAVSRYRTGAELFADVGDERGRADTLYRLGRLHARQGELDRARSVLEDAVRAYLDLEAEEAIEVFRTLVDVCDRQGANEAAREWCLRASEFADRHGETARAERFAERREELLDAASG